MKKISVTILSVLLPFFAGANENAIREEINAKVTQLAAMMGDSYSQEYREYREIQILKNGKL